jgi:hypothetical protein
LEGTTLFFELQKRFSGFVVVQVVFSDVRHRRIKILSLSRRVRVTLNSYRSIIPVFIHSPPMILQCFLSRFLLEVGLQH